MSRAKHAAWLAFLVACGDDTTAPRASDPGPDAARDAAPAQDAAGALDAEARDAAARDAALLDAAPIVDAAMVSDATSAPDASTSPLIDFPSTPTVARDAPPGTQACSPSQVGNPSACLNTYCVAAVNDVISNASTASTFRCGDSCGPVHMVLSLHQSSEAQLNLQLVFGPGVTEDSHADALHAALLAVEGESFQPANELFFSRPEQVDTLTYAAGRLHITGWGMVEHMAYYLPLLGTDCNVSPVPSQCQACEYQPSDGKTGFAWLHYDVEAPVAR